MSSGWKECKLCEVVDINHGYAFQGKFFTDQPTENVLVTPGNFNIGGGFKSEKLKFYNGEVPEEYILHANDVIVTMTDLSKEADTLGYSAIVPEINDITFLHNQRIGRVNLKSGSANLMFINWLLRTDEYRWYIIGSASGSTVWHTSPSRMLEYQFLLPPPDEQRAIAGVLSSLDDKIDLLHRQNKTLEGMAEALWRKMFVEEADPGWEEISLLELVELIGGGTPKTETAEYWGGTVPWLSAKDITANHKGFITETEKTITEAGLTNSSAKLLPAHSTIISARGTVGNYCMLSTPMAFSQSNYGILPKINECYFFTYLLTAHVVDELRMSAYGSVFDTITTNTFRDLKIRVPSKNQISQFEDGIKPYFNRAQLNTIQIHTLSRLRDKLLPKLMSGEMRVKDE